ncbi:MAG: hypothetical protein K0S47_1756 [Herbinix sp.]|jgi:hypothetical protein|nr:hypothetical protein [Herbinix sp.]
MNQEQQILFHHLNHTIIQCENEFIIHPYLLGMIQDQSNPSEFSLRAEFHIEDYQLYLDTIVLYNNVAFATSKDTLEQCYQNQPIFYNGTILIADEVIKEYSVKGNIGLPIYSYKSVYELTFQEGILTTTIDHSKAMVRIRKNIELGLRSLSKSRDIRCINKFIDTSFVGDYKPFRSARKRAKYLEQMKFQFKKMAVSFYAKN